MTELHELTALDLAAAYRSRDTSPREVVDHLLARIDAHSDAVGAFVTVTASAARRAADAATERLRHSPAVTPPLLGVPTAIKDLNQTAGVRTTFGSVVTADTIPQVSDELVLRIERAGLISLGKTNTPEFGSPCYTEPEVAPPARTAYDLQRSAGGSSGGAAAAVAAGLLPLAQGSDGGGSIRIPASVCGLVGLKPSRGRVSSAPVYGDVSGLSAAGPLATTVRDAAALLDAMAGPAVGDPTWAPPLAAGDSFLAECDQPPGPLRIARFSHPPIADGPVHPEVLAGYNRATALLETLGHRVEDVDLGLPGSTVALFETVWFVGAASWPLPAQAEKRVRPLTQWLRARGRAVSGPGFAAALVGMRQAAAAVIAHLAPYDAVLTPTLAQPPVVVGGLRDDADPAADFEAQKRFTPFTAVWNVTGMPAVSLPLHWTVDALPVGMMLAGRPGEDALVVRLAAQVEAARAVEGRWPHPRTPFTAAHGWARA
ncbi:amidase [soil metagenome]